METKKQGEKTPSITAQPQGETEAPPAAYEAGANGFGPAERPHSPTEETRKKQRTLLQEVLSWVRVVAIAVAIGLFLRFFVVNFVQVQGNSMLQTLHPQNYVLVEKVSYYFTTPTRGDVVVLKLENVADHYIKRVIGLPGDVVEMTGGSTYINGEHLEEPYLNTQTPDVDDYGPYTVPEGHVFVMGDNRYVSMDSRNPQVGMVPLNEIEGMARLIIWPLDEIRGL
ncbi:MAG: signal peptidase I [Christensenellales bacterium]